MRPVPQPFDERRAVEMFELAQVPQFQALLNLLQHIEGSWYAEPPRTEEQRAAWETFTYIDFSVRHILTQIQSEIELGARLSNQETAGEPEHEDDGHNGRRRA